jgi:hypothetical protein
MRINLLPIWKREIQKGVKRECLFVLTLSTAAATKCTGESMTSIR